MPRGTEDAPKSSWAGEPPPWTRSHTERRAAHREGADNLMRAEKAMAEELAVAHGHQRDGRVVSDDHAEHIALLVEAEKREAERRATQKTSPSCHRNCLYSEIHGTIHDSMCENHPATVGRVVLLRSAEESIERAEQAIVRALNQISDARATIRTHLLYL